MCVHIVVVRNVHLHMFWQSCYPIIVMAVVVGCVGVCDPSLLLSSTRQKLKLKIHYIPLVYKNTCRLHAKNEINVGIMIQQFFAVYIF